MGENQLFEIVEYQFARAVFVTLDFIDDDFHFLVYLGVREGAMKDDVCQQFYGTWEMFGKESTVYDRFFLVGIGIEVAAYMLHSVQNMPSMSFLSTLEKQVFHEVCHSLFVLGFVSGSSIYGKATLGYCRLVRCVDNTQAIGEGMGMIIHVFFFFHLLLAQKYNKSYCPSSKNTHICMLYIK